MTLGKLLLSITFVVLGVHWLGWVVVSSDVLGVLALATGVVLLLEGLAILSVSVPTARRAPSE